MPLTRRHFLHLTAATTLTRALPAQTPTTLTLTKNPITTVPPDFTGLSYESPQLANPAFFSPANKDLVAIYRDLTPHGVLRTGGNLSAFTLWRDSALNAKPDDPTIPVTPDEQAALNKGKKYWEWDLTDPTIRHGNHEAIFTPASIETLAGFLDATGWKLLYGLNFGTGTPQQAAAEAACVHRLCGPNLLGFQLGNEIDYWTGGLRPRSGPDAWNFDNYYKQWLEWVRIIRSTTPNAPMAGPDVASNLSWMEQLAEHQGKDLAVLTKHHYVMGPAGNPAMDAHRLLGPDPDVAKEIASAQRAKKIAGVGFRTAECGSCFHGGQPGVSNAFASALWAADYMLTLAQGGHAGINMHGGGDGFYSPITGDSSKGFTRQPLFFGMQFANQFAGATLLESTLSTPLNISAYAATRDSKLLLALINKDSVPATITLPTLKNRKLSALWKLSAPALDSLTNVTFAQSNPSTALTLPPYTAHLLYYA